jgi:nucleotide-binding universal stress UspA family protein
MVIVVPYDGSDLSRAALERAAEFADTLDADVRVVTAIPSRNRKYARKRNWLGDDEEFNPETVVSRIRQQVEGISPAANFEYEVVGRYAQAGEIASQIRKHAKSEGAELVVIGSENAGRIVSSVSSVGSSVATDDAYDVLIVRHTDADSTRTVEDT